MKLYALLLSYIMNDNCLNQYIHNHNDLNQIHKNLNNDLNNKLYHIEKRQIYKNDKEIYLNIKNDKKIDVIDLYFKMKLLQILETETLTNNDKLKFIDEYQKNFKNTNLRNIEMIKSINITNGGLYNDWNSCNF